MLSQSLLNIVCKAYFYSVGKSFRNQLNQIKVTITVILYICAWFSTNRNRASSSFIARNKPLSVILRKQEFVALTSMQLEEQSVAFSSNETPHGSEDPLGGALQSLRSSPFQAWQYMLSGYALR
jgi:hypothetical protein